MARLRRTRLSWGEPDRPQDPAPSATSNAAWAPLGRVRTLDDRLVRLLRRNGIALLRAVLGVVFLWFGALKLTDVSPAAPLVEKTVPFLPAEPLVYGLGGSRS